LLEIDAFQEIHGAWRRLGYPFESLVPSYATAIGVSGDTPAALAKLVGIILNDGVLYPSLSIRQLHFGAATPAETILTHHLAPGERLLDPVIARIIRREMIGVVENGTGRRLQGGFKLSDGTTIAVGGKTGTGDNEFRVYGPKGGLLGSRVINRTAAFAFFIGDRFFGTILAFVPGKEAANYEFTSALAVQVLKDLSPVFLPMIEKTKSTLQQPALLQ
jgi:membrane peptidoglycan carboxypeptidase